MAVLRSPLLFALNQRVRRFVALALPLLLLAHRVPMVSAQDGAPLGTASNIHSDERDGVLVSVLASDAAQARMTHALTQLSDERDGALGACLAWALLPGIFSAGTWLTIAVSDESIKDTRAQTVMGRFSLTIGGVALAHTAGCFFWTDARDKQRLRRWHAKMEAGEVEAVTLARFEGELRADAEAGRSARRFKGMAGVGTSLAGIALGAFAVSPIFDGQAEFFGYLLGGVYLLEGLWTAISNFTGESPYERAYRQYLERHEIPKQPPTKNPQAFRVLLRGLGLSGQF